MLKHYVIVLWLNFLLDPNTDPEFTKKLKILLRIRIQGRNRKPLIFEGLYYNLYRDRRQDVALEMERN